jgi:hypothetical protein
MPSPDVTPYVDLRLFDDSSQNIYLRALDYALAALPEFQPREGGIEVALLQAMALEVQDAIFAINRVPGAITEILLKLLDIQRQAGSRSIGVMQFNGDSTASFVVPEGTRLFFQLDQDSDPIVVQTRETVTGQHTRGISGISRTGNVVTVSTGTYHGLAIGQGVTITGTSLFNEGPVSIVSVPSLNVFTFESSTSGSASAGAGGIVLPDNTISARALVEVETEIVTEQFNGTNAGTQFGLLSVIPPVTSAFLATTLLGGRLPETDNEYFTRGIGTLSRLSTGLATANQIERYIAEGTFDEIYRVKAVDSSDQTRNENVAGFVLVIGAPIDSSASVILSGVGDGSVGSTDPSYGVLDEVRDAINERVYASLAVEVSHPCFVTVSSSAQIKAGPFVSSSVAQIACTDSLDEYFSSNTWPWSRYARVNEVIARLRQLTISVGTATYSAVEYVSSVDLTPVKIWLPPEAEANAYDIASITHAGDVVTITTSSSHGVSIESGETLYLWVEGVSIGSYNTSVLVPALTASDSTFTYSKVGSSLSSSGGRVIAAVKKLSSGDLYFMDVAPLALSGDHAVTVV